MYQIQKILEIQGRLNLKIYSRETWVDLVDNTIQYDERNCVCMCVYPKNWE